MVGDRIAYLRPAESTASSPVKTGVCLEAWAQAAERDRERILRPYVRHPLLEAWRNARRRFSDPVRAWESLRSDPAVARKWQRARGFGGFVPVDWEEAEELLAAALVAQVRSGAASEIVGYGGDPSGALVAAAAGSRFVRLLGGTLLAPARWESSAPAAPVEPLLASPIRTERLAGDRVAAVILAGDLEAGDDPALRRCVLGALDRGAPVWVLSDVAGPLARLATHHVAIPPEEQAAWWFAVARQLVQRLESEPRDHPVWRRVLATTDLFAAAARRTPKDWSPQPEREGNPVGAHSGPSSNPSPGNSRAPGRAEHPDPATVTWWDVITESLGVPRDSGGRNATPPDRVDVEWGRAAEVRRFSEFLWRLAEEDEPWLLAVSPGAMQGIVSDFGWAALGVCLAVAGPHREGEGGLYLAEVGYFDTMPESWRRLALAADCGRDDPPVDATQWFRDRLCEAAAPDAAEPEPGASPPRILLTWRGDPFFANHLERERLAGMLVNPEWNGGRNSPGPFLLIAGVCERLGGTAALSDVLLPAAGGFERTDIVYDPGNGRLLAAVPARPARRESRDEWAIFASLSRRVAALAARSAYRGPESPQAGKPLATSARRPEAPARTFHPDPVCLAEQFSTFGGASAGNDEGGRSESSCRTPSASPVRLQDAAAVARRLLELWVTEATESPASWEPQPGGGAWSWEALLAGPLPLPAPKRGAHPASSSKHGFAPTAAAGGTGGTGGGILFEVGALWRRLWSVQRPEEQPESEKRTKGKMLWLRLVPPVGSNPGVAAYALPRELFGPLEPIVLHPDDADSLGLANGDLVFLETDQTAWITACRVEASAPPGTALFCLSFPWLRVDPDALDLGGFDTIPEVGAATPRDRGQRADTPVAEAPFPATVSARISRLGRLVRPAGLAGPTVFPATAASLDDAGGGEG
ncbi:MAG: hypothetical protein Kow00109_02660 [Acidobacteriota bacterium]